MVVDGVRRTDPAEGGGQEKVHRCRSWARGGGVQETKPSMTGSTVYPGLSLGQPFFPVFLVFFIFWSWPWYDRVSPRRPPPPRGGVARSLGCTAGRDDPLMS